MSKEEMRLYVIVAYAKRSGWPTGELPPLNADGSVPYEAIGEWFDRTCYYAADVDKSEEADRVALDFKEIDDMPEDA